MAPIERTVKFATTVPTIEDAWRFMMTHLDEVGARPNVEIHSTMQSTLGILDEEGWVEVFTVVVWGMTEVVND